MVKQLILRCTDKVFLAIRDSRAHILELVVLDSELLGQMALQVFDCLTTYLPGYQLGKKNTQPSIFFTNKQARNIL